MDSLLRCPFCGGVANIKMWCEPDTPYLVMCESCKASVKDYATEAEAVEAWNRRAEPAERTVKVVEHDASVTDTDGYKYHRSEYLCGTCKKKVIGGDDYCSHCGARLEWNE